MFVCVPWGSAAFPTMEEHRRFWWFEGFAKNQLTRVLLYKHLRAAMMKSARA